VYRELLNSDAEAYGGSNLGNWGAVHSEPVPEHGRPDSLRLMLPPLSILVLKRDEEQ
jgi:1,4-alpha-glucan branching enzyme